MAALPELIDNFLEYLEIKELALKYGYSLWGATTNPSLIAKKLSGKKITQEEAFQLQREIVMKILKIVPGAVSAEVYADQNTSAEDMTKQGKEIATWDKRIMVKLPTTLEGFKARTNLRKEKIPVNNTLVFSQEQVFAICLHEEIMQKQFGPIENDYPSFISPFVGRLDDIGLDGMQLVEHGMDIKKLFQTASLWMLEASIRRSEHIKRGIDVKTELLTIPTKAYKEWFLQISEGKEPSDSRAYASALKPIPYWNPPKELLEISTIDDFMQALESNKLNIKHELTDKGIIRFTEDWKAIIV